MRIGIFDPYLDDLGGGEKYMLTLAACLSKNHDVEFFWDNQKELDEALKRFSVDLSRVKRVSNIFSQGFTKKLFATKKYDAIIVLSDGSIPFVLSKKLFIHIQQPLKQFQYAGAKEKFKLSRVTAFFCNSEFTKSYIDKKFGIKTFVLYPPVTVHSRKVKKENIILHVGRFRAKNIDTDDYKKQSVMIEAFKKMVDNGLRGWKFVVAASVRDEDKERFAELQKAAKNYPIEFLLNKTNEQLWSIYSKAKIYWHASGFGEDLEQHPEFAEHFGISTVEAMGAGCVPVVINAGGQKEIVEDGKSGFLWNTIEELEKKTRTLVDNEKLLAKMSGEAKKQSEKFSGDRFCQEANDIIK